MLYIFILESIGTSELLLIGMVALIIFGPRKLPEMMRTVGKTIAEFKRSTNDFKQSWEKEVDFEKNELNSFITKGESSDDEDFTIGRNPDKNAKQINLPEIREVDEDLINIDFFDKKPQSEKVIAEKSVPNEEIQTSKRDWI